MYLEHPLMLLFAVPLWWAYRRWWVAAGLRGGMRIGLLAVLVLLLAGPTGLSQNMGSTLVLIVDRSQSMPALSDRRASDLIKLALEGKDGVESLGIVGFGRNVRVERFPKQDRAPETHGIAIEGDASNLHAALEQAIGLVPEAERCRVLVLSDGMATDELSTDLVERLNRRSVPIFFQPVLREWGSQYDAIVSEVLHRNAVDVGGQIDFTIRIAAKLAGTGRLRVHRDQSQIAERAIELVAGSNTFDLDVAADEAGTFRFTFEVEISNDPIPENNRWETWVQVRGEPAVLVVSRAGGGSVAAQLLTNAGLHVQAVDPHQASMSLPRLSAFDGCVMENVPASDFTPDQLSKLAVYVEQLGGGLMITGGAQSFLPGRYRSIAIEPLLPVLLQALGGTDRPAQAIVVLADGRAWGSIETVDAREMSPIQKALVAFAQELDSADRIGLVTLRTPNPVVLPLAPPRLRDVADAGETIGLSDLSNAFPAAVEVSWNMLSSAIQPGKHLILLLDLTLGDMAEQLDAVTIFSNAVRGASLTLISPRQLSASEQAKVTDTIISTRVLVVGKSDELIDALRHDLDLVTGRGFVRRDLAVRPATESDAGAELPHVSAFHPATLRDGAEAVLVYSENKSMPLMARWQRQTGRVVACLFPIEPRMVPASDPLGSNVAQQVRWIAHRDKQRPRFDMTLERQNRAVSVRLVPRDDTGAAAGAALPTLIAVSLDNNAEQAVPLVRDGAGLVGAFALERFGPHVALLRTTQGATERSVPVSLPRSAEFLGHGQAADGYATLAALAERSGGAEWTDAMPLVDPPETVRVSLIPLFSAIAAILVVLQSLDRNRRWSESIDRALSWRLRREPRAAVEVHSDKDVFLEAKDRVRRRLQR